MFLMLAKFNFKEAYPDTFISILFSCFNNLGKDFVIKSLIIRWLMCFPAFDMKIRFFSVKTGAFLYGLIFFQISENSNVSLKLSKC